MKNILSKFILSFFSVVFLFSFFASVHASVTPTLSATLLSDGDSVQLNVTGDPDSSVILYYTRAGVGQQINVLGSTASNGSFSATMGSSIYGIAAGSPAHVVVGGVNGVSSNEITWPAVTSATVNQVSLSQTGISLSVGQTNSITITNNNSSGTFYISNNSSPTIASASLSGNTLNISAIAYGSTSVTICATGNTTNCPSVYVTVANPVSQSLTFSQSNVNLTYGQNIYVTVSGGTGYYTVTNNTNQSLVQTNINGSSITFIPSSASGLASVTVCTTNMNSCGIITANVNYSSNGGPVSLSQSSLTLTSNQSSTVSISGGTNPYVLPQSSNGIFQANINGSTLNITGLNVGSAQISVCSSSGGSCAWLSLTVLGSSVNTPQISLSQTNLSLISGQNSTVTITGNGSYYLSGNTNPNTASAVVSGNNVLISAVSFGSTNITVCQSGAQCGTIIVSVTTINNNSTNSTSFLKVSNSAPSLMIGQNNSISISGGLNGNYNVSYNSNTSIVSASLGGNTLTLTGIRNGYAVIVVCDSVNNCAPIFVVVGSVNSSNISAPVVTSSQNQISTPNVAATVNNERFKFEKNLSLDSVGTDVFELQKRLKSEGFYSGPITGKFGPLTKSAVIKYQKFHKINPIGTVGLFTRTVMNNI